jgi:hypothetical protein
VTGRKDRLSAWPELVDVGNIDIEGNIQAPDSRARPVMEAVHSLHAYGETLLTAIKRVLDKEEPDYRQ